MKEKIKKYLKKEFKKFKFSSTEEKFHKIIVLILLLDLILFIAQAAFYNFTYYKEKQEYNKYPKKVKIQEKIDKNNISFTDSLKIIKNIDHIEFSKKNFHSYIIDKDKFAYVYQYLFPYSISRNIEPYLIKHNIPYFWTDKKINAVKKPELKHAHFIITDFVTENILKIAIYGFFIFYLIKSMPNMFNKKFEIVYPKDIKYGLNSLVGMDPEIKREILQLEDMIKNMENYHKHGIRNLFNIMFSGPAGTGKSRTASALAKELNIPMVIGTGNVETGFVGGGANTIQSLFKEAEVLAFNSKSKTAIIFLDEAQTLFVKRGQSREKWADDAANELLAQLDGVSSQREVNIVFIAASNFDESNMQIDEAMERRFKKKIFFRLPDQKERKEIIDFYIQKIDSKLLDIQEEDIEQLSKITSGISPAKIETIINEASLFAIRTNSVLNKEILFKSFERIIVGMTSREEKNNNERRKRIVYHELGHFITQFEYLKNKNKSLEEIKKEIKILKISSEAISQYNVLGYVLNEEDNTKLNTRHMLEEEMISLYGGYAAESFFYNGEENVSTGAFNDIEKVSKILKKMIFEMGMYSSYKVNFNIVNYNNLNSNQVLLDKTKDISEKLYTESYNRVKKYKDLIEYLNGVLLSNWTLDKEELFAEIEKFYTLNQK